MRRFLIILLIGLMMLPSVSANLVTYPDPNRTTFHVNEPVRICDTNGTQATNTWRVTSPSGITKTYPGDATNCLNLIPALAGNYSVAKDEPGNGNGSIWNSSTLSGAYGVAVSGGYAYVTAYGANALSVVDVSDPSAPVVVGSVSGSSLSHARGVVVSGGYAYVAAYDANALSVVDVSDPSAPVVVGSVSGSSLSHAWGVAVSGGYAYVAAQGANATTVVDVSDPSAPVVVGSASGSSLSGARGIAVSGGYAYVTASGYKLSVVDVSDPSAPVAVGSVGGSPLLGALGVAVSGGYAYVAADSANALTVVDVSDPSAPVVVGSVSGSSLSRARGVVVSGGYAYVTAYDANALSVVDVSDPSAPVVVGSVSGSSLSNVWGVRVSGGYAYVAAYGANALSVVDVSNPFRPSRHVLAANYTGFYAAPSFHIGPFSGTQMEMVGFWGVLIVFFWWVGFDFSAFLATMGIFREILDALGVDVSGVSVAWLVLAVVLGAWAEYLLWASGRGQVRTWLRRSR